MNQIAIGTCIPGNDFLNWAPALKYKGFECFSINFHMSLHGMNLAAMAPEAHAILSDTDIRISALGFYCNALQYEEHEKQLHECIDLAHTFGTNTVSTFAGALEGESVDAAMPRFKEVFGRLVRHAEDCGVRLAIENCAMGGVWNKNTCNIGFNPAAWDMMFQEVDSPALGLEWEPAHQLLQLIDPIANLRKYAHKVVHVHGKDASLRRDLIASEGVIGKNRFAVSRFPGLGDTDWRKIIEILQTAGYTDCISIEGYHDPILSGASEMTGQVHALNYLKWCRGGTYTPNPWEK